MNLLPPVASVVHLQMLTELDTRFLRGGASLPFLYPPGLMQNFEEGKSRIFHKSPCRLTDFIELIFKRPQLVDLTRGQDDSVNRFVDR